MRKIFVIALCKCDKFKIVIIIEETRGIIVLLFYTENAIMKQTLNGARYTAQRLASSVKEFTGTLQSHPFDRKRTSWGYEPPTGFHR